MRNDNQEGDDTQQWSNLLQMFDWTIPQDVFRDTFASPTHATHQAAADTLAQTGKKLFENPQLFSQCQKELSTKFCDLWMQTVQRMTDKPHTSPEASTKRPDKRFTHSAWDNSPYFNFLKESYLMGAQWAMKCVEQVSGPDSKSIRKATFFTRQIIDALAPSNFPFSNPSVIEKTLETGGGNLMKGMGNFLNDLENSADHLLISMTNPKAFELGKTLATTPGKVVFQNELFQLIQYEPTTKKVFKVPLLIIPPWINKYYIFDLSPENSFVRWAVSQGHTVFIMSWINPDERLQHKTFEDYMLDGAVRAIETVSAVTNEPQVNLMGYCLGGNLLACTLSYLAQKDKDLVASATYMATLVDFANAGDLSVFIDEKQIQALEDKMFAKGYISGDTLAATFNMLRSNDLIWSFFVQNYLLGEEPQPLDFFHWNADYTNIPARVHSYYLRNMFQKNLFSTPGGLSLGGVPIDLSRIQTPSFILAAQDDHISPWTYCYEGTQLYKGAVEFVLATSGHVAGVINSPNTSKYSYMTGNVKPGLRATDWRSQVMTNPGSWWNFWHEWTRRLNKAQVLPRKPGTHEDFPILEDAPGSYVTIRA